MQDIEAIKERLKDCQYNPDAKATYDLMAGGLLWSDEGSPNETHGALRACLYLRGVIAYRASLSQGEPRIELEEDWNALKAAVPGWPGFREDRVYGHGQRLLRIHKYKEARALKRLDLECFGIERTAVGAVKLEVPEPEAAGSTWAKWRTWVKAFFTRHPGNQAG